MIESQPKQQEVIDEAIGDYSDDEFVEDQCTRKPSKSNSNPLQAPKPDSQALSAGTLLAQNS